MEGTLNKVWSQGWPNILVTVWFFIFFSLHFSPLQHEAFHEESTPLSLALRPKCPNVVPGHTSHEKSCCQGARQRAGGVECI